MNDTPDHELLRRYADHGTEAAFTALVQRHCSLVWAAARRVSGNGDIARDVAQSVFTDLARKAGSLPANIVLAGWLYRAACHAAANHIRGEVRRTHREQAAMQHQLQQADAAEIRLAGELQPLLDATLGELAPADRDAVVLRFLANRSLAEVGATLGVSEDTAQKRVSRALEKLREAFRQRGVTVSGGVAAAALSVAATQAAPVGMAAAVASGALAGAGAGASAGTFSLLFLMKSKLVLGLAGGAVVASALAWQQHTNSRLEMENAALRQQVASLPATTAVPSASAVDAAELARLREEHAELLRLRGQLAQLIKAQQNQTGTEVTKRLQAAEARAGQAEAEAAFMKAEAVANQQSAQIINALKSLGLAARMFSVDHAERLPTTFDEMRSETVSVAPKGTFPGGISPELFEFLPHERTLSEREPEFILFREKTARHLPNGKWERAYCLTDGSVQREQNDDGDFSQYDREHTATLANAPKKQ